MDISNLGSITPPATTPKSQISPSIQAQSMTDSMLVSQLPSLSMPGIGSNLDLYAAIGKQNMGYLSGGQTSMELASISLGIDYSKLNSPSINAPDTTFATDSNASSSNSSAGSTSSSSAASTANSTSGHTNSVLNDILKADGFTPEAPSPYVIQKDFFANQSTLPGTQFNSFA